ncbi:glycosyltransferase [Pedobacter sp. MR2016-24]|uniref:glycosyltransferase n=1 Tax=Pedobacter sp. MR2016-24 TaxID=2994466 RepID=UPI002245DFB8|nr:glycosyltransferase [Pedobacter sp. MR2016-24]MCX2484229.1 glycosyltransferase [Pedobacter sp. MR2016-24]
MVYQIIIYLWYLFQLLIGFNLYFPIILLISYTLFVRKRKSIALLPNAQENDYAIIVTAYQEISHIPQTVNSLLELSYKKFLIYLVLDNCDDISSLVFNDERVIILKPETVLAGNTKSHFYAIERFVRNHNILTIIDSDNLVDQAYLTELNVLFSAGFRAVQGVRSAKNMDTNYAKLDAARDLYYHFYDGLVLYKLGSSATLAGSGMAFHTSLYKECLQNNPVSGAGFDKVLQYELLKRNERIAFAEHAIVYDQKTSRPDQLVNQRSRWINTWFKYFKYGFFIIGRGLKNFSFNQLLFGVTLLRPPLFMFLVVSLFLLIVNLIMLQLASALFFVFGFVSFVLAFYLSLVHSNADSRIYNALVSIPKFMFLQIVSLIHSRNANKRSVATRHFNDNNKE